MCPCVCVCEREREIKRELEREREREREPLPTCVLCPQKEKKNLSQASSGFIAASEQWPDIQTKGGGSTDRSEHSDAPSAKTICQMRSGNHVQSLLGSDHWH